MWSVIVESLYALWAIVALSLAWTPAATSGKTTRETAEQLMERMGGKANFDAHRFLTFRFVVERDGKPIASYDHAWDRTTGRYRLEATKDGKPLRVLFNVNDRQGRVWLDWTELEAQEAEAYLDMAYERFINDSYWLLMPWKWLDPGVTMTNEGERTLDGEAFDVVSLGFGDNVGLTPKDRYWAFVSEKDGLMKRWEFLLQQEDGSPGTGAPTAFSWEDWREAGDGLLFSRRKIKIGPGPALSILFPEVAISRKVDEPVFVPPASGR